MSEQLALALHRRRDPSTSRSAAARVDVTATEQLVLDALVTYGPSTAHEIAFYLDRPLVSISPRMRPLVGKGKVREAGTRERRTVWQIVEA